MIVVCVYNTKKISFIDECIYFLNKFNISLEKRFSTILSEWEKNGDLTKDGADLVLSRDALLRVDSLLHQFFLPHHQDARYV